jgi:hypothetical protein
MKGTTPRQNATTRKFLRMPLASITASSKSRVKRSYRMISAYCRSGLEKIKNQSGATFGLKRLCICEPTKEKTPAAALRSLPVAAPTGEGSSNYQKANCSTKASKPVPATPR